MDERLRFVARLLEGEKMAELCREFGISRKTGYKIFTRYKNIGLEGLTDRSRRPLRQANRLPFQVETLILSLKREHPSWGAPKIRAKLRRRFPDLKPPAISTVHAVLERIQPGKPTQNGRHERMHLTLKKETTKPAGNNFLQQQEKFDRFIECYNQERPHQAIEMRYPGELYRPSDRPYHGLDPLEYPFHDRTVTVTMCGRVCFGSRKINLSTVFAGQNVGVKEVDEKIWLISFMHYDLGFFDHESNRFECAESPFAAKVLPMSSV